MMFYKIAVCITFLYLVGCNTTKVQQVEQQVGLEQLLNHSLFNKLDTPSERSIFELPNAEKEKFLAYAEKQKQSEIRHDRIIYNYLESNLANFKYHGDTLTSAQALKLSQGNCISLAVLTQSYAQALGLETSFQEVTSKPIYAKENNVVYVASHFRTRVYAPKIEKKDDNIVEFFRAGTLIDYFPTRRSFYSSSADYNDLVSKFYSNLAATALAEKQLDIAYSLILQANKYTPNDPELFNIAGVLHRRAGDLQSAKNIYQTALRNNEISINLISNYQLLAKKLGDKELVKKLTSQLVNKEKDPYELLVIAKNDLQAGHAHQAKAHLEQAITKAPYIAELYLELAKVRYQQGNIKQTQTLLEKAIELERDNQKIDVYQAKLLSLQMDK
ncbi:tetratricopeptide repeat protein [Pseudoalteromonas issachenkonii]|uniref:Tetratricopeptide repeat protein n=1 Tax=Pseudoalteromonas issachenkonii TaxID=152297 RepID=A0ABU9H4T8_9GAMM